MLAEAFVSVGCYYYDNEEIFPPVVPLPYDIVIRRSLPHRGQWIDFFKMIDLSAKGGYDPIPIGIIRSKKYAVRSVIRRDSSRKFPVVATDYHLAMRSMGLFPLDQIITYEGFVNSPSMRRDIFARYGLPEPLMKFYDGNAKYYGQ